MWHSNRLACLLFALLVALASNASAASLAIDIGVGAGAPIHLTPDLVEISPGVFISTDSLTVAGSFQLDWDLHLEGDPMINGSFMLHSLSSITQTFSVSATLGVLPVPGPTLMGGFVGPTNYIDTSDDGVTFAASPFYEARIDGSGVQTLGSYLAGPTTGVLPIQSWGVPIPSAPGPGVLGSIGVAFPGFSLTAFDTIDTQFGFEVVPVPEPASAALLGFGLTALAARKGSRRRLR